MRTWDECPAAGTSQQRPVITAKSFAERVSRLTWRGTSQRGSVAGSDKQQRLYHSKVFLLWLVPRRIGMWPKSDQPSTAGLPACHESPGNQKKTVIAPVKNSCWEPLAGLTMSPSFL